MKKILSLLTALSITTITATSSMACSNVDHSTPWLDDNVAVALKLMTVNHNSLCNLTWNKGSYGINDINVGDKIADASQLLGKDNKAKLGMTDYLINTLGILPNTYGIFDQEEAAAIRLVIKNIEPNFILRHSDNVGDENSYLDDNNGYFLVMWHNSDNVSLTDYQKVYIVDHNMESLRNIITMGGATEANFDYEYLKLIKDKLKVGYDITSGLNLSSTIIHLEYVLTNLNNANTVKVTISRIANDNLYLKITYGQWTTGNEYSIPMP